MLFSPGFVVGLALFSFRGAGGDKYLMPLARINSTEANTQMLILVYATYFEGHFIESPLIILCPAA
jgi:hypothetical protein